MQRFAKFVNFNFPDPTTKVLIHTDSEAEVTIRT